MTFRSKPAVKRSHRPSWEEKDRRNLYINIGFALVIFVGVLALVGAGAATYYAAHFSTVATVNGTSLNQDQLNDQATIDKFRIDQAEAQLADLNQLGRLSDSEYQTRLSVMEQQRSSVAGSTLDRLVDNTLQGQLAAQQGIIVTDAQVDQRLLDEATTKEQRRLSMISVQPEVSTGATVPTDAQKAAAKAKAEAALAEVKGGQKFADVAQKVSTDAYAANGGDTGWSLATEASLDSKLLAAAFATAKGGLTDVIEGADGSFRFAQVVDVAPQTVDPAWTSKIEDARIPMSTYRTAVRSDLVRDALKAKILADVTEQATAQRQVSEIFVSSADYQGPGDQVKVRHILYTPGDADPSTGSPLPSDAASLAAAKVKAQATYDKLQALQGDPAALLKEFETIAKTDSKDTTSGADGGQLGWFTQGQLDRGFGDAIFAQGLKDGDLVGPVQSQYGWHVILYEARRGPPEERINGLQTQVNAAGADFAALARANSDATDAATGGDMRWVARYQLAQDLEDAIFAAPVGKPSASLQTSDGYYLFLVRAEETRKPDAAQLSTLKTDAFTNWYTVQRAKAVISTDAAGTTP